MPMYKEPFNPKVIAASIKKNSFNDWESLRENEITYEKSLLLIESLTSFNGYQVLLESYFNNSRIVTSFLKIFINSAECFIQSSLPDTRNIRCKNFMLYVSKNDLDCLDKDFLSVKFLKNNDKYWNHNSGESKTAFLDNATCLSTLELNRSAYLFGSALINQNHLSQSLLLKNISRFCNIILNDHYNKRKTFNEEFLVDAKKLYLSGILTALIY